MSADPLAVRDIFKEYGSDIDASLLKVFEDTPQYEMYDHLAYFMGFKTIDLKPEFEYGGKRFRSSLCLMLADWYGKRTEALPVATSLELYHNFTLIHDDIVDGDTLRRGRPTVWKQWGIPHAINDGDVQLLLAQSVVSRSTLTPEIIVQVQNFLTTQYIRVIEGQYLDFTLTDLPLGDEQVTEDSYFEMIGRKTADLIAAATKAAGIAAEQNDDELEALFAYGYNLGMAYQVCDDLVSIWGNESVTGKRPHNDILERKKTLPIIYAHTSGDTETQKRLTETFNDTEEITPEHALEIVQLLDSVGVYETVRVQVDAYATKAKEAAERLSITAAQQNTLKEIVDVLLPDIKNG